MEGAPYNLYRAMQRIPGVEAYWYEARTNPKHIPKADLTVAVDWAEDALGYGDYIENHPNVYWCSDSHLNEASWNFRINKAKRFDKVFVSIWSDVEKFKAAGVKAEWLPYAAEPLTYRSFPHVPGCLCCHPRSCTEPIERIYDIGFMGFFLHNKSRCEFLDAMIRKFPNHRVMWDQYFEHAAREMASYKVNLNHCHVDATNMRFFECMAGGNCLLTPHTTDTVEFNAPALIYPSLDGAYELVRWALDHPEEREAKGSAAREWVRRGHTYLHRAFRILNLPPPPDSEMDRLIDTWPSVDRNSPVQGY